MSKPADRTKAAAPNLRALQERGMEAALELAERLERAETVEEIASLTAAFEEAASQVITSIELERSLRAEGLEARRLAPVDLAIGEVAPQSAPEGVTLH